MSYRGQRQKTISVAKLPKCDICSREGKTISAQYDAPTSFGPWANLCSTHFRQYGRQPATKLELIKKRKPSAKPKSNVVHIKLTRKVVMDGVATVRCPFCKQKRRVEPDANYPVKCESCGETYQVRSMF